MGAARHLEHRLERKRSAAAEKPDQTCVPATAQLRLAFAGVPAELGTSLLRNAVLAGLLPHSMPPALFP